MESKIRRLLGNEYHLSTKYTLNGIEWVLYKRYMDSKVYFSMDNEAIMSSKTHTMDDLYKFAKEHHKLDDVKIETTIYIILSLLLLIFQIINFTVIKNDYIKGFILGTDWIIIISCLIKMIVISINDKKTRKELLEYWKRDIERWNMKDE